MEVNIDSEYRITTNVRNYILETKKVRGKDSKNTGEEYWVEAPMCYYTTLAGALQGWKEQRILNSDVQSVQELQQLITKLNNNIEKLINQLEDK